MQDQYAGIEYDLMVAGNKHLTLLHKVDVRFQDEFVIESFGERWLVYKPENYKLARCFVRSMKMLKEGKISIASAHTRRGILLDYDKAAIRKYVRGRGQWETKW